MHPTPDFSAHRASLLDALEDDEAILLFSSPTHRRNGDSDYRYRPESDVYWLTGWEDPQVAVFLRPGDKPFTLFVQPKDPTRELWDGFRHGPAGACDVFGADQAFDYADLPSELQRLVQGVSRLHYAFARDPDNDALLTGAVARAARAGRRNGLTTPETFHHPSLLLHELRLRKSDTEIALLRKASEITAVAHRRAMAQTRPGVFEYEIEAELVQTFQQNGSTGAGYTPIVAGGNNANVLHYVRNRDPLQAGDMLLVDAGCEVSYYTADVTRTWPVDGKFTDPQRRVYEWVLKAQLAAIDQCRAGIPHSEIHYTTQRVLTEGMVDMGLLEGPVEDRIEDESFKKWFPHGTSHWLGLDVHDVGSYGRDGHSRALEPRMVLTVEPGLYIPADADEAPEEFRGIGVRIEDDVLITEGDPVVLTGGAPKSIEDVEAAMRG
jgi:Xaa-Pro aminopeptidase